MEKKVYQIRYTMKDKETKKLRNKHFCNIMAIDIIDAEAILREEWSAFEIEEIQFIKKLSLEQYIITEDTNILLYRKHGKIYKK